MKMVKEWEGDIGYFAIGHRWCYEEDDFDGTWAFKFVLFDFFIAPKHFEFTLFNFCVCYQWNN